ncbi:MAG: metalloregulator ArsR/SmtB family transcription factor [Limnohabitans sp.]|nr:metalloregulator ArsR/SmtB family transcription factor [Limnohabitans sp.]
MVQIRKRRTSKPQRVPATPRAAAACSRPVDGLLDPALFKALGDPTRVQLLACLMKCGRACLVGEVAECCSVDLSVVSRHLQALAREGVVESSKAGRMVSYRVCYASLAQRFRDLATAIDACAPIELISKTARRSRVCNQSQRCEGASCGC